MFNFRHNNLEQTSDCQHSWSFVVRTIIAKANMLYKAAYAP